MNFFHLVFCTLFLNAFLLTTSVGCGIDWDKIRDYFEGVHSETGTVSVWDNFGNLDLGNGESLPLYYNFGSSLTNTSPYLGQGWYLPLLESTAVQTDENTFKVTMPNGKYYWFWRDRKNPTILNGQQNWKAEVRENSIVASAECGGKATFVKGKMVSFVTKGGKMLEFVQLNGKTSEIRSGSEMLLKVETDPRTGQVTGLSNGSKHIGLEQGERPQVQQVQKQNLVTGKAETLNKVTLPDGTMKTYDFGVNDQVQPTLQVGKRLFVWDAASGRILMDGEWTYSLTDLKKEGIARTGAKGQTEFWFYDGAKGQETVGALGKKTTTIRFTSGKLAGAIRDVLVKEAGREICVYKASYDENGKLVRYKSMGDAFEIRYNSSGTPSSFHKNGDVVWRKIFDSQGRFTYEQFAPGFSKSVIYMEKGFYRNVETTPSVTAIASYDPAGKLIDFKIK